jgi:peptidyl-prolyl cis-trans isomerase C
MSWHAYPRWQLALAHFSALPWQLSTEQLPELERQLARKLALEELVLASELATQVQVTPQMVNQARSQLVSQYGSEAALLQIQQQAAMTDAELLQALSHELRVNEVLTLCSAGLQPMSDSEARRYYLDHPRRFLRPERREVRHILITTEDDNPDSEPEVQARLLGLREILLAEPHQFGELALRHSECPTAMERGRIGVVTPGQLYPELDSCLFALPLGALSQILRSPMGLHLIQCLDIQEAAPIPMDEALPKIIEQHLLQARQQHQRRWLKSLQRTLDRQLSNH